MKFSIVVLLTEGDPETTSISITPVTTTVEFRPTIGDTHKTQTVSLSPKDVIVNSHLSIVKHAYLSQIPNLRIRSTTFDISENVKTFCNDVSLSSTIFNSKDTGKVIEYLTDGIIFTGTNQLYYTNFKGKSYKIASHASVSIKPGSFCINTTNLLIPRTIVFPFDFGSRLCSYQQQLHHPWAIPPIIIGAKRNMLIPKLITLSTRSVEEVTNFCLSLKETITMSDFLVSLDNLSYFSEYSTLRNQLRDQVKTLTFVTSYQVLVEDLSVEQKRLAHAIFLAESDSFRDLSSFLIL